MMAWQGGVEGDPPLSTPRRPMVLPVEAAGGLGLSSLHRMPRCSTLLAGRELRNRRRP
jgi:hypothetical protein